MTPIRTPLYGVPLPDRRFDRVHELWDELADFPITRSEQALRHLLARSCEIIGACNACWLGAVRLSDSSPEDPVHGWRPRSLLFLHPLPQLVRTSREGMKKIDRGNMDLTTMRNAALAGTFRVNRLVDLVPAEWFESKYYRVHYRGRGHDDAIWAGVPINSEAECYYGIYRSSQKPHFSPEERDAFGYILRGLKWFHRRQMLSHGLAIARSPLTRVERDVLHGLLTGKPEKDIAASVGHSYHTTHDYVRTLFRKFGVKNRAALMALWIGRA
jgi:DNA-binding CsgD family transcriptional regulator